MMKPRLEEMEAPTRPRRRLSLRYPAHPDSCAYVTPQVGGTRLQARIYNVSRGGISLELAERVTPGSLLAVELRNSAQGFVELVILRVLRTRQTPAGAWQAAGVFAQGLSPEALDAVVGRQP